MFYGNCHLELPRMTILLGNKFVANLKKSCDFLCFLIKRTFKISQGKINLNNQMKNIASSKRRTTY